MTAAARSISEADAAISLLRPYAMLAVSPRPQPIPGLTRLLLCSPPEDLEGLVRQDALLIEAIYGRFPEHSSELDFGDLTLSKIKRLAPQMLRAIGRFKDAREWTATESAIASMAIDRIVSDLLDYLGLPETQTLACTALVIIFIKGLKANGSVDRHRKP